MKLSIVTTVYKSEVFLETFLNEIINALDYLKIQNFEIIFVIDGITDNSKHYLLQRKSKISQIKIVELSRNFGHHYAIQAGLNFASGDYVFLIDNDLEVSPNILVIFYNEIIKDDSLDVVYGYQEIRKGNFIEKFMGSIFWILINRLSDTKIPHNILTERLMTKQYVSELLRLQDANLFMGGMMYWVGFNQRGIPVRKEQREGTSTYSFKRRAELMLQAITSFSGKPLEWLFYFGLLISICSGLFLIYLAFQKLMHEDEVQLGWTSIVTINILILGVVSTFLGLIGIYIYKIFRQVQGRPNAIIKKNYE
jgi:putative glycosyltransferase